MDTLGELDGATNYRKWIVDLARPALNGRILEVGAGHGTMTEELAEVGPVVAIEPDEAAFGLLQRRFAGHDHVSPVFGTLASLRDDDSFGSAVMINVLEHIADDAGALTQLARHVEPGGGLMIWVPAFQLLYSDFDRNLGHHRRYRRRELQHLVESSGWIVERVQYVNLPGWFSWLVIARFLRTRPTGGALVRIFDRVVVPVVRAAETYVRPPFGQSIVLLARRPDAHLAASAKPRR